MSDVGRWFRFREAFGLPLPPPVVWVRKGKGK